MPRKIDTLPKRLEKEKIKVSLLKSLSSQFGHSISKSAFSKMSHQSLQTIGEID